MPGVALHDWDGRIPQIAKELERSPFDRVFLCVEERHVQWRKQNVIEAVETLKGAVKEVYLDPWRVGGVFAGETFGTRPVEFERWCNLARQTFTDGVFLDEPNKVHRLSDLANVAEGLPIILGLEPERKLSSLPPHDGLAISTYFFPPRPHRIGPEGVRQEIRAWHEQLPSYASVWVQTWSLVGEDWLPKVAINEWMKLGREVNVWSWEACATVSAIRSENHKKVWQDVWGTLRSWGY